MCGICGIYDLSARDGLLGDVQAMAGGVHHRGPDDGGWLAVDRGNGVFADASDDCGKGCGGTTPRDVVVALGHRRLSIIDLSTAGHQPMGDPSRQFWIVYNGEVYNYLELRTELVGRGREFRSNTDTEVVLQAFMEWGPACLARFNGMWAFAIYDRQTGSLFCARDRYGIKPFYYAFEPGRFAFASEAKQLVKLPWVGATANQQLLADFFLWGFENHTDETFFEGVRSLPGSHYLMLSQEDVRIGHVEPQRYWRPQQQEPLGESFAIQEFRELFFDSVRIRLRSDVPVGVTVSGGLDSSSVVCAAGEHRRLLGELSPLDAFNVEFEGAGFSERRFAESAASRAGARTVVLHPSSDDLARDWSRFIWHMEQPVGGLSYFSNFQIYRLIREHGISVVLSGQGGDELLLGYERYRSHEALFALRGGKLRQMIAEVASARSNASMSLRKQVAYALYFSVPRLRAMRRRHLVRPILRKRFYRKHQSEAGHLFVDAHHRDRRSLQQTELFHHQLPHLLHHEDRVSMAHSVETRLPFLDFRLLELVLGQPSGLLFRDGWSKYILRAAMSGTLPEDVRWRTDKMGYETPTRHLIRGNRDLFLPLLRRHKDDSVLDCEAVIRRFDSNSFDERLLCSAVTYLAWKEEFSVA